MRASQIMVNGGVRGTRPWRHRVATAPHGRIWQVNRMIFVIRLVSGIHMYPPKIGSMFLCLCTLLRRLHSWSIRCFLSSMSKWVKQSIPQTPLKKIIRGCSQHPRYKGCKLGKYRCEITQFTQPSGYCLP